MAEKKVTGYGAQPTVFQDKIPEKAQLLVPKTPQQIEEEKFLKAIHEAQNVPLKK